MLLAVVAGTVVALYPPTATTCLHCTAHLMVSRYLPWQSRINHRFSITEGPLGDMVTQFTSTFGPRSLAGKTPSLTLATRDPSWTSRQADEALLEEV